MSDARRYGVTVAASVVDDDPSPPPPHRDGRGRGGGTASRSCHRARKDARMISRSRLITPAINLGLPKMGSTTLQSFLGCAGYGATHWMCQRGTMRVHCAQCIANSVGEGLPPLEKCGGWADVYAEINGPVGGRLYFPQVELLGEIVRAYPNATYFLTFRDTRAWHASLSNFWSGLGAKSDKGRTMRDEMIVANITGFDNASGKGGPEDFDDFFCHHVERVREVVPLDNLVEIDLDDTDTGRMISEMFDVYEGCWGRTNVNSDLHPGIDTGQVPKVPHLIWGKSTIRGKNGTMRIRPIPTY
ncbi:hypothetical protein ACHAXA_001212 [Cyclostephanos tholiformis]|uniref:Sulfotransferase n=1 Tax=Cyclostephanos tholiformis TaxID=382380 RepID=A0ABD3SQ17_9STRA